MVFGTIIEGSNPSGAAKADIAPIGRATPWYGVACGFESLCQHQMNGYKIVKGMLDPNYIVEILDIIADLNISNKLGPFEGSPSYNKFKTLHQHPLIDKLLEYTCSKVEQISSCSLVPRYGHIYLYEKGQTLEWHQDKGDCYISSSTCISKSKDGAPWMLEINRSDKRNLVDLEPNESIVFDSNLWHGRPLPLQQSWQLQLMLMFADADGKWAKNVYNNNDNPS